MYVYQYIYIDSAWRIQQVELTTCDDYLAL